MKQYYFFGVILSLLLLIFVTPSINAQEAAQRIPSDTQPRSTFFDYLQELGNRFDCFFTLEEGWGNNEVKNNFQIRRIEDKDIFITAQVERSSNVEMALVELQKGFPGFSYYIDLRKPRIIHIIDTRLSRQPNPLDNILPSIDFSGRVGNFIATIGRQESRVKPTMTFDTGEVHLKDLSTEVKVQGVSLSIRELLSNFIDLKERRSRVLWIARTQLGTDQITYIHYLNSPPQPKVIY